MTLRFAYRVRRQKAAAAAAVLLGLVVVAASGVSAGSRATIGDAIEHNARGAYDLLVTAGAAGSRTPSSTGMVEQNFTALTGSAQISANQLAAIDHIPGVDVAAPLAFMGDLTSPAYGLLVGARDPDGSTSGFFTTEPKVFDVSVELDTTDGVQTQTLSSTQTTLALARVGGGDSAGVLLAASGVNSADTVGLSADVTIPGVPQLTSGIVAVDPAAEQALLGGGQFLQPLAGFDQAVRDGAQGASLTTLVPDRYDPERSALAEAPAGTLALPLVVSDSAYAPLHATVTVTPVDTVGADAATVFASTAPGMTTLSAAGQQLVDRGKRGTPQTTKVDLTHRVVPFAQPYFSIPLPGAAAGPEGAAGMTSPGLTPSAVPGVQYTPAPASAAAGAPANTAARMQATPQGFQPLSPTAREQTYRPLPTGDTGPAEKPFLFAPLGTYTPGDVTGTAGQVSYVPLGTYAAGTATVTQHGPHQGAKLGPSFSGRGLELAAPGAITSLDALRAVRPGTGMDVVRVRVAGPRTYDAASIKKIETVAARIADLGLQVRVVAGSSLTPVGVYVPDFFAQPASGSADLGWTEQEWTSLGAAVTVQRANLTAAAWLFAVSLLAVTVLAAAVQVIALDGRRRETALLLELGWRRRRILGWFLAEGTAGLAIVAASAVLALVFNAGNPLALTASLCAVAASLALTAGGAWLASHGGRRATPRRSTTTSRPARSAQTIGGQVSRGRPLAAGITGLALVVLALTATAFTAVLTRAQTAAGNSRLSELVTTRVLLPHLLLAALGCAAGGALFAIGTSQLRAALRPQLTMLVSGGWAGRELAVLARATVSRPARPALLIGTAGGVAVSLLADPRHWWLATLPAPAVMLLTVALAQITATVTAHRLTTSATGRAPRPAEATGRKALR